MAIQKQIWQNDIVDNLYPDNSFASKSVDDSAYVSAKTVHIPNAGKPSGVKVNRETKPADAKTREDQDLEYNIDELTTDPIYIPNADTVELAYDKRKSILANDREELATVAAQNLLYKWASGVKAENKVETTGAARKSHTTSTATGNRKKIVRADVLSLMTLFDSSNVPETDRYLVLDANMYADLLSDMTESDRVGFFASADAKKGIVGQLYSFNIMKRSRVLRTKGDKSLLEWDKTNSANELAAGLAWQQSCVSRALGEVKMFDSLNNPAYYGDIYSFLVRTGGAVRRYDGSGVALLVEAPTA